MLLHICESSQFMPPEELKVSSRVEFVEGTGQIIGRHHETCIVTNAGAIIVVAVAVAVVSVALTNAVIVAGDCIPANICVTPSEIVSFQLGLVDAAQSLDYLGLAATGRSK